MPRIMTAAKALVVSSLLSLCLPSCASTPHQHKSATASADSDQAVNQNLSQLVAKICTRADTGIFAQSMKTGRILYAYKADKTFVPASNMKTITAYAALKYLGPGFRYHTLFLTDAASVTPRNGVLEGNLYVKFDGDPTLQLQDLNAMVKQLSNSGIRVIQGNLVIDTSRYDSDSVSPGTVDGDRRYCYGAPVEAAILNKNCLSFRVLPASRAGMPAVLDMPYGMSIPLLSTVSTSASHNCHLSMVAGQNGAYHLDGCIAVNAKGSSLTIPVPQGSQLGESAMVAILQQQGLRVLGDHRYGVTNQNLKTVVDFPSATLAELVVPMMKNSDNLFANTLFKTVGSHFYQQSGTWQNSSAAVKAILQANGVDTGSMVIVDGSGLSRNNLISAKQFVQVLRAAYNDPVISRIYYDALPVGGLNGTLKHRLGFRNTIGKVHAKTGSMKGVSSLSGYIETTTQDTVVFSILVNDDFNGSLYPYRSFEDQACRYFQMRY